MLCINSRCSKTQRAVFVRISIAMQLKERFKGELLPIVHIVDRAYKELLANSHINSLGSIAHICAQLFRTFRVHSAYMRQSLRSLTAISIHPQKEVAPPRDS